MSGPDGVDRRRSDDEFKINLLRKLDAIEYEGKAMKTELLNLSKSVEHSNANTKAFKVLIDEDIQNLRVAIQGDEGKGIVGLASRFSTLIHELSEHIIQDRWAYGIMITLLITTLGWTVFHAK